MAGPARPSDQLRRRRGLADVPEQDAASSATSISPSAIVSPSASTPARRRRRYRAANAHSGPVRAVASACSIGRPATSRRRPCRPRRAHRGGSRLCRRAAASACVPASGLAADRVVSRRRGPAGACSARRGRAAIALSAGRERGDVRRAVRACTAAERAGGGSRATASPHRAAAPHCPITRRRRPCRVRCHSPPAGGERAGGRRSSARSSTTSRSPARGHRARSGMRAAPNGGPATIDAGRRHDERGSVPRLDAPRRVARAGQNQPVRQRHQRAGSGRATAGRSSSDAPTRPRTATRGAEFARPRTVAPGAPPAEARYASAAEPVAAARLEPAPRAARRPASVESGPRTNCYAAASWIVPRDLLEVAGEAAGIERDRGLLGRGPLQGVTTSDHWCGRRHR